MALQANSQASRFKYGKFFFVFLADGLLPFELHVRILISCLVSYLVWPYRTANPMRAVRLSELVRKETHHCLPCIHRFSIQTIPVLYTTRYEKKYFLLSHIPFYPVLTYGPFEFFANNSPTNPFYILSASIKSCPFLLH